MKTFRSMTDAELIRIFVAAERNLKACYSMSRSAHNLTGAAEELSHRGVSRAAFQKIKRQVRGKK